MKYISIFGYYGFENTGDDAVLRSLLDDLCQSEETLYIVVFSDDPQKTEALYADAGIHACRWDDHACLNMAVSQSDLLLIGGGGLYNCYLDYPAELLLKGNHRYFSVVTFGLPFLARIWGTPCAVIGCGASEVLSEEAREHIGVSLTLLSEITVRDEGTKAILSAFRRKGGKYRSFRKYQRSGSQPTPYSGWTTAMRYSVRRNRRIWTVSARKKEKSGL